MRILAKSTTDEFLSVIDTIVKHGLNSSVSLDLSHVGLTIDKELALENMRKIGRAAIDHDVEIIVNMEWSECTSEILEVQRMLSGEFPNIGITIQAYLNRSEEDLQSIMRRRERSKIRLVKGAYSEPPDVAIDRKSDELTIKYCRFLETILENRHPVSIATHDQTIIGYALKLCKKLAVDKGTVEFEMNYGISPDRLQKVKDDGFRARVYLPYGREWFLYMCQRIAEYPPNLYKVCGRHVSICHQ